MLLLGNLGESALLPALAPVKLLLAEIEPLPHTVNVVQNLALTSVVVVTENCAIVICSIILPPNADISTDAVSEFVLLQRKRILKNDSQNVKFTRCPFLEVDSTSGMPGMNTYLY